MKSFLELEGLHVFVTGAAGGIGSAIVDEFLGMYVLDSRQSHSKSLAVPQEIHVVNEIQQGAKKLYIYPHMFPQ
jgi:NAD(P)-dependent dehydrogenase (short-subunit alcohol dehydrogenase family)